MAVQAIEAEIRTALLTMDAVTAIVGTGDAAGIVSDAFPQAMVDALNKRTVAGLILIEVDDENGENDLDGKAGLVFADVTITCRGLTRAASRALAAAVRTNGTDPGTGLAGYAGTFDAWLEDKQNSWTAKDDGSQGGYCDVILSFVCSFTEVA